MTAYLELWSPSGRAFVDLDGQRMTIGSDPGNGIAVGDDWLLSRVHAVFESYGSYWSIRDLGSRNGTYVNGTQIVAERVLHSGDELRLGRSRMIYCTAHPAGEATVDTLTGHAPPELTRRERDVLVALCRPLTSSEPFSLPGSIRDMASELTVTEAAVKQHLLRLYDKFGVSAGAGRRVRLANEAIRRGAVSRTTPRGRTGA